MNENDVLDPTVTTPVDGGVTSDEPLVLDPFADAALDTGIDAPDTDTSATNGTETGDSSDTGSTTVVDGGDTYVNVVSGGDFVSRVVELDPYVEGDSGALVSVVKTVFGDYQPRTQTVTEVRSDGSTVTYTETVDGFAGLDWYWLGGVLVFCIVLLSFFKFLGGIFKAR